MKNKQKNKLYMDLELAKGRFFSKITSFLLLKFEYRNYIFPISVFHLPFMTLKSAGFKPFAKIMGGNSIFCYLSCINFNPTSHLKPSG